MRVSNENLISTTTVSMSSSFATNAIWLGHIANLTIQLVFTGSPAGSFSLQICSDKGNVNAASIAAQDAGLVNWSTISGSTQLISAAGSHTYELCDTGANWIRVLYTSDLASGGTLTSARAYVKGI